MPRCLNPECEKEVPKDKKYCGEECLKRHLELKKASNLTSEEDIWLGQGRRKRAMNTIMRLAEELCPIGYKRFICTVAYRTGLSYRKISDDYLEILTEIGLLKLNDGILTVGKKDEIEL